MTQPVWKLSVDVEAKTATFKGDMGEAAKTARKSFTDIEHGAAGMAQSTRMSMTDAREGVMLLGEQFGIRLPRALTTFLAELGPVAGAIDAAFPFIAVAALAGILIEKLVKLHEAGIKLTEDQIKFGSAAQGAFNDLDKKLLQAGITADDLSNNHLDALHKKLQLIDMQSMDELSHTFGILQKAADALFKDLDSHWYTFGKGSTGAKHALDAFQTQYESLLAQGKNSEASDLLKGTRDSAVAILAAQKQMQTGVTSTGNNAADQAAYNRGVAAHGLLIQANIGWTHDEVQAQQTLVDTLNDQVTAQGKIGSLTNLNKSNATKAEDNGEATKRAAMAREGVASKQHIAEQGLAADRATADAALTVQRASIEQRLASDISFAGRERDIKEAANKQDIAALDKSGKEYAQQLKTLQDAALGITAEYNTKVTELKSKASVAENARDMQSMEQLEALKIAKEKEGTAARMAVINSAIAEEQAKGLENTQHYQELLRQRESEAQKEAEVEKRLALDALDAQVRATQEAAAEKARASDRTIAISHGEGGGGAKQIAIEKQQEAASYQIKQQALRQMLAMYQQAGQDRVKQALETQAQLDQLTREHQQQQSNFNNEEKNATRQMYAEMANDASQSLMQVALGHQSLAATVQQMARQGAQAVISGLLEQMAGQDAAKLSSAELAAANTYATVSAWPVVGPVLAPILAATAFAGAMAFESGGVVPGVGKGDVVPAMLTPGEGIVPGGVMDGLRNMARNGGMAGGNHTTVHVRPTYNISTIDGDGMKDVLNKHTDQLQQHFETTLRKMNR